MMGRMQKGHGQNGFGYPSHPVNNFPNSSKGLGMLGRIAMVASWILIALTFPLSLFFCFKALKKYERGVIFRLGRFHSDDSHGIFFVVPCVENFVTVDLRPRPFDITALQIITKDGVKARVDGQVYSRVSNPGQWVSTAGKSFQPQETYQPTQQLARSTLADQLGTRSLHDILTTREYISTSTQALMNESTLDWGIKIERVEIQNLQVEQSLGGKTIEATRDPVVISVKAERNPAIRALGHVLDM